MPRTVEDGRRSRMEDRDAPVAAPSGERGYTTTARALMKLLAPLGKKPRKMQGALNVDAIANRWCVFAKRLDSPDDVLRSYAKTRGKRSPARISRRNIVALPGRSSGDACFGRP